MVKAYSPRFELLVLLIKRDLKVRYQGSVLGYLWSMINPLLFMSVLTIVFSQAMRIDMQKYPLYALSGLIFWNIFSQSLNLGVSSFVDYSSLLKKITTPSWVFPLAVIGSAVIHGVLSILPFCIISIFLKHNLKFESLQVIPVLFLGVVFIIGIVLILSSLNVFFRDIRHVLDPVLQLFFYLTPVLYPLKVIPVQYAWIVEMNPITYFVNAMHLSLFDCILIEGYIWAIMLALSSFSLILGFFTYNISKDKFLYYV